MGCAQGDGCDSNWALRWSTNTKKTLMQAGEWPVGAASQVGLGQRLHAVFDCHPKMETLALTACNQIPISPSASWALNSSYPLRSQLMTLNDTFAQGPQSTQLDTTRWPSAKHRASMHWVSIVTHLVRHSSMNHLLLIKGASPRITWYSIKINKYEWEQRVMAIKTLPTLPTCRILL